jgi:hypothetical protein
MYPLYGCDEGKGKAATKRERTRILKGAKGAKGPISASPSTSSKPSLVPSMLPSQRPSSKPSLSLMPSTKPSSSPTISSAPSCSHQPSMSQQPSSKPSVSMMPSTKPSAEPSESMMPSNKPSAEPSRRSPKPSSVPSMLPSQQPSSKPSESMMPSTKPSAEPSESMMPSNKPSAEPSRSPKPSSVPSMLPSQQPSSKPSESMMPSTKPSAEPSESMMPSQDCGVTCTGTGEVCDAEGMCGCDMDQCYEQGHGIDAGCEQMCECPEQCGSGVCDPELPCIECGISGTDCPLGYSCDGDICFPDGICSTKKEGLCDAAFAMITTSTAQSSKCCPDSSACVKETLGLVANAVCSTKCGSSCLGFAASFNLNDVPIVQCAFGNATSANLGLAQCYDDIVSQNYTQGKAGCPTGPIEGDGTVCCAANSTTPSYTQICMATP